MEWCELSLLHGCSRVEWWKRGENVRKAYRGPASLDAGPSPTPSSRTQLHIYVSHSAVSWDPRYPTMQRRMANPTGDPLSHHHPSSAHCSEPRIVHPRLTHRPSSQAEPHPKALSKPQAGTIHPRAADTSMQHSWRRNAMTSEDSDTKLAIPTELTKMAPHRHRAWRFIHSTESLELVFVRRSCWNVFHAHHADRSG